MIRVWHISGYLGSAKEDETPASIRMKVPLLRWNHRCPSSFRVVVPDPILQHVFRREAPVDCNRKQLDQEELPILATHGSVVTGLWHDCDPRQRNWKAKFMAFFSLRLTASCLKKAVLASGVLLISAQGHAAPGSDGPFLVYALHAHAREISQPLPPHLFREG